MGAQDDQATQTFTAASGGVVVGCGVSSCGVCRVPVAQWGHRDSVTVRVLHYLTLQLDLDSR